MYNFVSLDNITMFLNKFGIDFTLFSAFEQSVIILLSNIIVIIFWCVVVSFFYKLVCRFLRMLF